MKLNKKQAEENIKGFFSNIKDKNPEKVKKMKKLAMAYNIKLKDLRKKFCQKCYSTKLRVRSIKKGRKLIECINCGRLMGWKIR